MSRRRERLDRSEIPLTNRELQVLRHVALGLSNREIGRSLGISIETVKEHVQNILRKIDAADRTQAAVWAIKKGPGLTAVSSAVDLGCVSSASDSSSRAGCAFS